MTYLPPPMGLDSETTSQGPSQAIVSGLLCERTCESGLIYAKEDKKDFSNGAESKRRKLQQDGDQQKRVEQQLNEE